MFASDSGAKKEFFNTGDLVFKEGDDGDAAYIVQLGAVGIFKNVEGEEVHLATMTEGELFGEMAIIDGSQRMAHARVLEESVVVRLPVSSLSSRLDSYDPFTKQVIQILVENLRNVHEIYMKRPRSIYDFVNATTFHAASLRRCLKHFEDEDFSAPGREQLAVIYKALSEISAATRDF
jgi:CRP-like cAMP-binding protein